MNLLKKIIYILTVCFLVSCNSNTSIQEYFVNAKDNDKLIGLDIDPGMFVSLKEGASQESVDVLASIGKVNIVAYRLTETDSISKAKVDFYTTERLKIKEVIKNNDLESLFKFNSKEKSVSLLYKESGSELIDEVIVFAYDDTMGFVLVRVTGDNIDPAKIIKVMNSKEFDVSEGKIKDLIKKVM